MIFMCHDEDTSSNSTLPQLDITRAISVGLVLGAFILFAIVGNIVVILSVACNRHLRTPTNYFIVNLAIADLLLSFTVLPFSAALEVLGYWVLGRIFCDIWAAVDVLCCTASILSLCAISIDRYIGVRYSLQYPTLVTRRKAILALLSVWVLSTVISIGPLLGWKEPAPNDDKECGVTEEPFYALFSSLGSFYIPLAVILVMYCRVYIVAKRTTKNLEAGVMKEMSNSKELTLRIHSKNFHEDTLSSTKAKGHNPRSSIAVKLFKFSREKKAAKTLGIVVGMFILCWLPFFIALPLGSLFSTLKPPDAVFKVVFWLGYFNSCLNPIIYPCSSKEFKRKEVSVTAQLSPTIHALQIFQQIHETQVINFSTDLTPSKDRSSQTQREVHTERRRSSTQPFRSSAWMRGGQAPGNAIGVYNWSQGPSTFLTW
uniref:Alpha-1B adrenergic receptor n=1 Tax=Ursus maritimus TaxID=29073 RepID=A0A452SY38_URSMA